MRHIYAVETWKVRSRQVMCCECQLCLQTFCHWQEVCQSILRTTPYRHAHYHSHKICLAVMGIEQKMWKCTKVLVDSLTYWDQAAALSEDAQPNERVHGRNQLQLGTNLAKPAWREKNLPSLLSCEAMLSPAFSIYSVKCTRLYTCDGLRHSPCGQWSGSLLHCHRKWSRLHCQGARAEPWSLSLVGPWIEVGSTSYFRVSEAESQAAVTHFDLVNPSGGRANCKTLHDISRLQKTLEMSHIPRFSFSTNQLQEMHGNVIGWWLGRELI